MEAARQFFTLERRGADGVTLRAKLEHIAATTKRRPAALDTAEIPPQAAHVFGWFLELNQGRKSNGFGLDPLGWGDIRDWSDLTATPLRPHEVRLLKRLDTTFLNVMNAKESADGN